MSRREIVGAVESFRGEYRFLSNFWPSRIVVDGVEYASVEHAYQAAKCVDAAEREAVRTAPTPGQAKRLARRVLLRADWESVKVAVMRDLVRRKFEEHADLAARLLETGEAELVEGNTWGDRFWGVCRGTGQNHLGRILMGVRGELRSLRTGGTEAVTDVGSSGAPNSASDLAV